MTHRAILASLAAAAVLGPLFLFAGCGGSNAGGVFGSSTTGAGAGSTGSASGGHGGGATTATSGTTTSTSTVTTSSTGGGHGGAGGAGAGGAGGAGGEKACDAGGPCAACSVPADCPATGTPCVLATCTASLCGTANAALGVTCPGGACDGNGTCRDGGPSCTGGLQCQGVSCCTSSEIPGGTFSMGRSANGGNACPGGSYDGQICGNGTNDDQPQHPATIATYHLDAFEVTVGRFRNFFAQYDGTAPATGAGAHPQIAGSGWNASWSPNLPASQADLVTDLKCNPSWQTWTDAPGANETYAVNCVTWYTAFAFCIWDGGYLPTEAEWEYAAAGGADGRMFPWGATDPSMAPNTGLANDTYSDMSPLVPVGNHPSGNGLWGNSDLAGEEYEWTLDTYDASWYGSAAGNPCNNCANLTPSTTWVARGGNWENGAVTLRAAYRLPYSTVAYGIGLRCARTP
jgi:formylglycine-generating enzyme